MVLIVNLKFLSLLKIWGKSETYKIAVIKGKVHT